MARLHRSIQHIVEFQPYRRLIDLVHQATKAERQLHQDAKNKKPLSYRARTMIGGSSRFTVAPLASKVSTGDLRSHNQSNYSGKNAAAPNTSYKPAASTSTSVGSTAKSSGIQCFKCGGRGHVIKEAGSSEAACATVATSSAAGTPAAAFGMPAAGSKSRKVNPRLRRGSVFSRNGRI